MGWHMNFYGLWQKIGNVMAVLCALAAAVLTQIKLYSSIAVGRPMLDVLVWGLFILAILIGYIWHRHSEREDG